jgi:anti-anti-sigma factor
MPQPAILALAGPIDSVTSDEVGNRIGVALDAVPSALILDFTGVTFVSSAGLRVLLMTAKRCRSENIALALHSIAPQIADVFGTSGVTAFLPVYDNREAALAAIA